MPKIARELTALHVKRLAKEPGFHPVGGVAGLALEVKDTLAASWILRVVIGNERPDLGCGGYPTVTLEQARVIAREKREQIRQGIDPRVAKKAAQDALRAAQAKSLTFDDVAKLAHRAKAPEFKNHKHANQWINTLTTYASPTIGTLPVAAVDLPNVISVLEPIWQTKTETATRVRQRIEAVLAYATVNGYREGPNPAAWELLQHALPKAAKVRRVKHHSALPWQDVGEFMAKLKKHKGVGALALQFAILTAARSGEVRFATWDEFDLGAKLWTIPAGRMKAEKAHRVPLSDPAIALLKSRPRHVGTEFVFSAKQGKPVSDNTLSKVLRDMGVDAVPHGFRSTFKDWARTSTAFADEVSELALAHVNSDATRAAYARDELLPKRKALMAVWAKYCDAIPQKANVVPMRARA